MTLATETNSAMIIGGKADSKGALREAYSIVTTVLAKAKMGLQTRIPGLGNSRDIFGGGPLLEL